MVQLSEIRQVVAEDLGKVDERLFSHTSSEYDFINRLIQHVINVQFEALIPSFFRGLFGDILSYHIIKGF